MALLVTIFGAFLTFVLLAIVHHNTVQGLKAQMNKLLSEKDQMERKITALNRQMDNLRLSEATLLEQLEAYRTNERNAQASSSATNATQPMTGSASQPTRPDRSTVIGLMLTEKVLTTAAVEKVQRYKTETRSEHSLEDLLIMLDLAPQTTVALYRNRVQKNAP